MKKRFFVIMLMIACATVNLFALRPNNLVRVYIAGSGDNYISFFFNEREGVQYMMVSCESSLNTLPESAQMRIRLFDDSEITLDGKRISKEQTIEGGFIFRSDWLNSTVEFPIAKEQIEKFKIGIKKFRLPTAPHMLEKSYTKDKIGKKLYNLHKKSAF